MAVDLCTKCDDTPPAGGAIHAALDHRPVGSGRGSAAAAHQFPSAMPGLHQALPPLILCCIGPRLQGGLCRAD
jgi:hypothetical protein